MDQSTRYRDVLLFKLEAKPLRRPVGTFLLNKKKSKHCRYRYSCFGLSSIALTLRMQVARDYYVKECPFEKLWMLIHGSRFRACREFAFQCGPDFVFRRWKGFNTADELAKYCRDEDVRVIHLGGVYNHPMKDKKLMIMSYVYFKEFVIDVDIDLYDKEPAVRTCACKGQPKICDQCWSLLVTAIQVFHHVLTRMLMLKHVHFYFSGRRGIHCVIWDPEVSKLFPEQKMGLYEFLRRPRRINGILTDKKLFPRIDKGVISDASHLVKAPFSMHKSGLIATEIDPLAIPTWAEMVQKATPTNFRHKSIQKTPTV
jgi:DNA primase catalytic subunit